MILNIALKNWMSFLNRIEFSMIATREQNFGRRLVHLKRLQRRVLPIATLFGGNASGKTNLCKALDFAQWFITAGHKLNLESKIPVKPFALDKIAQNDATEMEFTLLIDEDVYQYSFKLNQERVISESLRRLTAPKADFSFLREYIDGSYRLILGKAFTKKKTKNKENENLTDEPWNKEYSLEDQLHLISKMTRQNQLFLTSTVLQNVVTFKPVFDWFDKTLLLISPTSAYGNMERYADSNDDNFEKMKHLLKIFDTGISAIRRKEISPDALPLGFAAVVEKIRPLLKDGDVIRHKFEMNHFLFSMIDGVFKIEKLVPCHSITATGECVEFDFRDESDGVNRLLDLLPALILLQDNEHPRVIVIDEVDRCLHTKATRRFISEFLSLCDQGGLRSQLLLTTHDMLIMDTDLLRRDEMWAVERNANGESTIFSIVDYRDARKDSDIRTSYLLGRMGGIPAINDIL